MARDFGGLDCPTWRRGRRGLFLRYWLGNILLVGGFAAFAAFPTAFALSGGFHSYVPVRLSKDGPPCREITKAEFERGWTEQPRTFTFGGATFARRRGDADCTAHTDPLSRPSVVCAFDTPVAVAVAGFGHAAWFDVQPGRSASVEADGRGARCKITGVFRLYAGAY